MRARRLLAAGLAAATMFTITPAADAAVAPVGRITVDRHRGGIASQGGARVIIGLEADKNSKGQTTKLRGRASIRRLSKTAVVQIDRVRVQRSGTTLRDTKGPVRTSGSDTVKITTGWTGMPVGSCASYRTLANLTIRWSDGTTSTFTQASPYTRVCGPPKPKPTTPTPPLTTTPPPTRPGNPGNTKNCSDFRTWAEANAWYRKYFPHYGDVARLDADNDGIPCEDLL